MSEPLPCPACNGYQRIGLRLCASCSGTGHARCECGCVPAVTTSLTDRDVKLCAECAAQDRRDTLAYVASVVPLEIAFEFVLALPAMSRDDVHALIGMTDAEYAATARRAVAGDARGAFDDAEQGRSERIACHGEAWSGGFAENH